MESSIATELHYNRRGYSVGFYQCSQFPGVHALMLTGDVVSQISTTGRELVVKKICPLMVSLALEEFYNTNKSLFGPGFEQRLKTRSETAETIRKAVRAGKPFFRGAASQRFGYRPRGPDKVSVSRLFAYSVPEGCWEPSPQLVPTISQPPVIIVTVIVKSARPEFLPTGLFLEIFQHSIPQRGWGS